MSESIVVCLRCLAPRESSVGECAECGALGWTTDDSLRRDPDGLQLIRDVAVSAVARADVILARRLPVHVVAREVTS